MKQFRGPPAKSATDGLKPVEFGIFGGLMPVQDKWDRRAKRNYERKHNLVEPKVHVDSQKWSRFDDSDEEEHKPACHVKEESNNKTSENAPIFEATLEQFEQSKKSTEEDKLIREQIQRVQREYSSKLGNSSLKHPVITDPQKINQLSQTAEEYKLREQVKKRFGGHKKAALNEDPDFDEFMSTVELKPKANRTKEPSEKIELDCSWSDSLL